MSTYFFKTNIDSTGIASNIKPHLDKLERNKEIDHWRVHMNDNNHVLEIETQRMSPEQVKHFIRETGIDAEFTSPPQRDAPERNQ
jgi:hypothetical protein